MASLVSLEVCLQGDARQSAQDKCVNLALHAGVCALNIEAMSIMKRGMPPGGSNPFPTGRPSLPTGNLEPEPNVPVSITLVGHPASAPKPCLKAAA